MSKPLAPLPQEGLLKMVHLTGQIEITEEQARRNREANRGPRRTRPAINPCVPLGKSKLWQMVKEGTFPAPVRMEGTRGAFWNVKDVRVWLNNSYYDPQ